MVLTSASWGATYYVDPNGNDTSGNGSQASPWKTLSTACSKVTSSGNTIYLNAGNYTDNNRCNLAVGVNIQGAGKSLVTITSAYNGAYGTGYIYRETSASSSSALTHGNNDISGFTLDGSNKTLMEGIHIRGTDYITVHDMKFQHIHTHAINLGGPTSGYDPNTAPANYGLNDAIHDVVIDDCTSQTTLASNDRYGAIGLLGLANLQVYNVNINENYANHGTGIKAATGWLKNAKLHDLVINCDTVNTDSFVFETYNYLADSEIYNCTFNTMISLNGGQTTLDPGSTWNLVIHDNVFNQTNMPATSGNEFSHNWLNVRNNYFYGGPSFAAGLWTTNYLTSSGVAHWRFNNNVVYNCGGGIDMVRGSNSYIEIYNNTFDTMNGGYYGSAYGIWGAGGTATNTAIRNNLIIGAASGAISGFSGATIDHNWLNAANPGINGSGNRPSPYYVPNGPSSNLVNAGINVGLPYVGSAPDLGAFEYGGKTLNPPTYLTAQ